VFTGLENPVHLLIILLIAMLVLGPKRLPGIGRSLGSGIREFRDSIGGEKEKQIGGEKEVAAEKDTADAAGKQ
jgi:sec-independent protein translocase protein TatA